MNSIRPIIDALEAAYGHFNVKLFDGRLGADVVVTVQTRGRKSAYGWYGRAYWENGTAAPSEINLSAEDLKRDPKDVLLTLAHEMVHHAAAEAGIQDTSRNGRYHNRRFAEIAKAAGLLAPEHPDKRLGFSAVTWGPSDSRGRRTLDSLDSSVCKAFNLARQVMPTRPSKSKMLLFVCPCGYKIRAGRDTLLAQCLYCSGKFKQPKGA